MNGIMAAIFELFIFYKGSHYLREIHSELQTIPSISYYWLMFTILTGIWEFTFLKNRKEVQCIANKLITNKEHVWFKKYKLNMILPWIFSKQFYGEYGAYADREYKTIKDNWSFYIEGTHSFFCGFISCIGILLKIYNIQQSLILLSVSMAAQCMNSILYLGEYNIQTKDKNSINHNSESFPLGKYWIQRPFMYINLFWTIMPCYVLIQLIMIDHD